MHDSLTPSKRPTQSTTHPPTHSTNNTPRPQALLGPSGAGKSTLLEVLSLRRRPTAGRVSAPASRRAVGYVAQDAAFPPTLSALEVVRFYEALLPPAAAAAAACCGDRVSCGCCGGRPACGGGREGHGCRRGGGGRAAKVLKMMGLASAAHTLVSGCGADRGEGDPRRQPGGRRRPPRSPDVAI